MLGYRVDPVGLEQTVELVVSRALDDAPGAYVCLTNVHTTVESQKDERLRAAAADSYLSVPDGMPLVWILRRQGERHTEKVTGIEFMPLVARSGIKHDLKHFFYGGAPGVAAAAAAGLQARVPGTRVAGSMTPPFTDGVEWELGPLQEELRRSEPHILWVGLGAPKQEIWMHHVAGRLDVPLAIGVGAAFDFLAGTKKAAPRYLSRMGLEWLYRLASEPGRLWRRYLVGNSTFLYLLATRRFRNPVA